MVRKVFTEAVKASGGWAKVRRDSAPRSFDQDAIEELQDNFTEEKQRKARETNLVSQVLPRRGLVSKILRLMVGMVLYGFFFSQCLIESA
jgi:hypothetical protein